MQNDQSNTFLTLRNVQAFLAEHAAALPDIVDSGAKRKLDIDLVALTEHASDQSGNMLIAQSATQTHASLRTTLLRNHMAPIARIAIAELPDTPELLPLRMPKVRSTTERIVNAAYGMGQAAAPYANIFVAAGLPADFIAKLDAAAAAMLEPLTVRSQHKGKMVGATDGLKKKMVAARRNIRVLDALVRVALEDDSSLLADWNVVKRVAKTRVRSGVAAPEPVAPVTPPASAAA